MYKKEYVLIGKNWFGKCKNCGKQFRVTKRQMQAGKIFCCPKCKEEMDNYVYGLRHSKYMRKLRDKINYDPSKHYFKWKDDFNVTKTVEDGVVRYHSKNLGNYNFNHKKTKRRPGESWESYHNRLQRLLKNLH